VKQLPLVHLTQQLQDPRSMMVVWEAFAMLPSAQGCLMHSNHIGQFTPISMCGKEPVYFVENLIRQASS
jgi:hypothetical protein